MQIQPIGNGKNNLVRKIFLANKPYILKKYKKSKGKFIKYSRYKNETYFLNFLKDKNINIPKIVFSNRKKQENIFNYIEGNKVKKITKDFILQSVLFVKEINKINTNKGKKYLCNATEACLSIDDHIKTAEKRLAHLSNFERNYGIYKKGMLLVKKKLQIRFNIIKKKIFNNFSKYEIHKKINSKDLILSPSDFGFHNILERKKKLYFYDFEYAGMDDPVKLICDFLCQPDSELNKENSNFFLIKILKILKNKKNIKKKIKILIHIHRIKWCCIILSDLLSKQYMRRRKFAKSKINPGNCYHKAEKYYNKYIKKVDLERVF